MGRRQLPHPADCARPQSDCVAALDNQPGINIDQCIGVGPGKGQSGRIPREGVGVGRVAPHATGLLVGLGVGYVVGQRKARVELEPGGGIGFGEDRLEPDPILPGQRVVAPAAAPFELLDPPLQPPVQPVGRIAPQRVFERMRVGGTACLGALHDLAIQFATPIAFQAGQKTLVDLCLKAVSPGARGRSGVIHAINARSFGPRRRALRRGA